MTSDYLSCFSGIGGLEATIPPKAVCDIDESCLEVLRRRFPEAKQFTDISDVSGTSVDVVVGGWPCQDISIAGKQKGLKGKNSGLFYKFLKAAVNCNANTVVAENVKNLMKMQNGTVFLEVINEFKRNGYKHVSWRVLNAREFGLPHHRSRVFIIASTTITPCFSLFREIPATKVCIPSVEASGFYWTAGTQSICYSKGYSPTLKVGSGLSIPSPPAVHYENTVRQLSPIETLRLQGFDSTEFNEISGSTIYRMTGNAVARPVGQFVVDGALNSKASVAPKFNPVSISPYNLFGEFEDTVAIPNAGIWVDQGIQVVRIDKPPSLANNLSEFIDFESTDSLSPRAAGGLLRRLEKSKLPCPDPLFNKLMELRDNE